MSIRKIHFTIACCYISAVLFASNYQIARGEEKSVFESTTVETESTKAETIKETSKASSEETATKEISRPSDKATTPKETSKASDEETTVRESSNEETKDYEDTVSGNHPPDEKEEDTLKVASDSDAEDKISSDSDAEEKVASGSNAKNKKSVDNVFHVAIPTELPFRIDPFETNERGQIYSEDFMFQNMGTRDVKVNIDQMYCEFTRPEEYCAVSTRSQISEESNLKDLYLFLEHQGKIEDAPLGVVITDIPQVSTAYSFILSADPESENNKIAFRLTGAVNELSDYEWRSGEVTVVMSVSFEEIEPVEANITEEETLINDLQETDIEDEKETGEQGNMETGSIETTASENLAESGGQTAGDTKEETVSVPGETGKNDETLPKETLPIETPPKETLPKETTPKETPPEETIAKETIAGEKNKAKETALQ